MVISPPNWQCYLFSAAMGSWVGDEGRRYLDGRTSCFGNPGLRFLWMAVSGIHALCTAVAPQVMLAFGEIRFGGMSGEI
jgi:hypothetical protein